MRCYLCNGTSHRQRPGTVRDAPELKILECSECGLVFLSSFEHVRAGHYEASGMHGDQPLPVTDWLLETEADDNRRFQELRRNIAGKKLLDFGCGAGGFLLLARKQALTAAGVEPECRLQSHFEKSGLRVFASLDEVALSQERFDVCTAFHVLEHLPDPRYTLKQLARLLEGEGLLIIEVPSADDALLTLFRCESFETFTYWSQHLFLFNPRTLTALVQSAGLSLSWIKQVQRYPLSNHLHWLALGKPGGHQHWAFIDSPLLTQVYGSQLAALGKCDTLLAGISTE